MKKYLLSLLIVGLSFIGFSSADYVFNSSYTPSSITLDKPITDYDITWGGVDDSYDCYVYLKDTVYGSEVCKFGNAGGTTCDSYSPSDSRMPSAEGPFQIQGFNGYCLNKFPDWSLTLSLPSVSLLPGGQSALSGAISGLTSSVNEFIPYLVYISLGIFSALIGFVAIKRLINYVSRSAKSPFSSKKLRK